MWRLLKIYWLILLVIINCTIVASHGVRGYSGDEHQQRKNLAADKDFIAEQNEKSYQKALELINTFDYNTYETRDFIIGLLYDSVDDITLNIPYNYYEEEEKQYREQWGKLPARKQEVLDLLSEAADNGHPDSAFLLAEIYLYGNFSLPKKPQESLRYYKQAAALRNDGAANFMVGFIYSTGLFGKVSIDQAKANLYFKIAADLKYPQAMMTMGYRYLMGIAIEKNCELALFYYSALADMLYDKHLRPLLQTGGFHLERFAVRISDFNKFDFLNSANKKPTGMLPYAYGNNLNNDNGVFELPSSIDRRVSDLVDESIFSEFNLEDEEYRFAKRYYEAKVHYEGDYIHKRNYTKAFEVAHQCAAFGVAYRPEVFQIQTGIPDPKEKEAVKKYLSKLDVPFINQCIALTAHLYLRGEGVAQNAAKAKEWISRSKLVEYTPQQVNDMGLINEFGLADGKVDLVQAFECYKQAAIEMHNAGSYFNLARILFSVSNGEPEELARAVEKLKIKADTNTISEALQRGIYAGNVESLYFMGKLFNLLNPTKPCSEHTIIYKTFVEKMENYVSSLEWSLQSLLVEDYENSLLGYAMAAEQGYETAQSSAAFLLFQVPSKLASLPKVRQERIFAATNYLTKSSQQSNIDSMVLLGDYYYYNLVNDSISSVANETEAREKNLQKASICYQVASHEHSSQASWNLGYMYEHGIGVERDFHLAKRYYDLALVNHPKSFLPVELSLINLAIKARIYKLFGWEFSSGNEVEPEKSVVKHTWKEWWNKLLNIRDSTEQELIQSASEINNGIDGSDRGSIMSGSSNDDGEFDLTYDEILVLVAFAGFFIIVYGSQLYIRWSRRRDRERRRANGENVIDEPQPAFGQGLFVVVPL